MRPFPMPDNSKTLSVVVPCFNEEQVIKITHARLTEALSAIGLPYDIIYVNDGSIDGTEDLLRQIQAEDSHVRVLLLSRNFGQQVAMSAGIDHADGDAVVLMDADLQDPPEVIAEMVRHWRQGYQVVYATRRHRAGESALKRWTAKGFYRIINRLSDTPIPLDTGDFRLMDRRVVDALRRMPERDRFIRGMVSWIGFRQIGISYDRSPRSAGTSKYSLRMMILLAVDGILSFSVLPLRLAGLLGVLTFGICVLAIIYALIRSVASGTFPSGWMLTLIAVTFLGAVQLICAWIIGEYIGRIHRESNRRPLYILKDHLGPDQ